jgi:hypothetical protein
MMLAESSAREPPEPPPSAVVSFHEDGALDELLGIACSRFVDRRRRRERSVSPDAPP